MSNRQKLNVAAFLFQYVQNDPPTKESLAKLLVEFIQYQETKLGKNANEPQSTRLPMRCFLDFKPGGSLCHIFSNMYRYKCDQRWRKFEFNVSKAQSRKDKDPNSQLFVEIETALIEEECLRLPVAYIRPEVDDKLRGRITGILKRHQGEVTTDIEEATHIIYPSTEMGQDDYARPTFRRGKNVMIHWYYLPESYDSWVPVSFDLPVIFSRFLAVRSSADSFVPLFRRMCRRTLAHRKMFGTCRPIGCSILTTTMSGCRRRTTRLTKVARRKPTSTAYRLTT